VSVSSHASTSKNDRLQHALSIRRELAEAQKLCNKLIALTMCRTQKTSEFAKTYIEKQGQTYW
jgi:hypothetical protein